ncbi:MAG: FAD-dependent oxidoreductase [Pseudomonadota bacterium]|uniref:FAD-dependent oxidoreductase n=1 Tax=unclassified Phenylobacterium TaxID=2640670 RepID=UPI0006F768A1|nr:MULTISPECIES: FAD-dependent oxidoreductase [unclassified Phenylobacterium]KRB44625.1 FAD-dependent oxidoreductase [Phenylobacterium sp. Root700]MBT9473006.1 FAD-dependent oxidoreductase [Phenylobacterium sp.]
MHERVLVIGAGIAGLCTALALAPTGRDIVILERDPSPPRGDADEAFKDWNRRGVGHLRHSHAFLARLRTIIKTEHPELHAELLRAGCREIGFDRMLTDIHRADYRPQAEDRDFVVLTSRRTTLELVIRRYVEHHPNVRIASETFVRKLLTQATPEGLRVVGVSVADANGPRDVIGDIVIDAGGRTSSGIEQLMEEGAVIPEESETAGILYFTRHFRLQPGASEPPRSKLAATGDLGFLKFGVFPGDNGCFSITICVPEIELELRKAMVDPEVFNAVCARIPGLVPWIDPAIAEGVSRIYGMGELNSRWRDLAPEGAPSVLGYFAVGDNLIRTNPLYGRGCSFAAVSAYLLRDVLVSTEDAGERLIEFQARVNAELHPYYLNMRDQDRSAIRRARQNLTPGYRPNIKSRVIKSFLEDGVNIAVRSDANLLREALRGFHMLEHPSAWLKRPDNLAKILRYWLRGKARNAEAYPPKLGPGRIELMRSVGLSPEADMIRAAA